MFVLLVNGKILKRYDLLQITLNSSSNIKFLYYFFQDANYTNERIMNFLHTSSIKITSDSLYDLLQTNSDHPNNDNIGQPYNYRHSKTLDWTFYIGEHLGEYIMRYCKILNSKYLN